MKKRKLTRESLAELAKRMPVLSEEVQSSCIGGGTVKITVNRSFYGDNSTMSYFLATAYDDDGNVVSSMSGMFLEPTTDYDQCTTSGSDTAIKYGTYDVVPSTYHGQSGYYEVTGVDGRTGIKIHAGNTGNDTEGCLLPGTSGTYNSETGKSTVSESRKKLNELTDFLNQYGDSGITIQISA
ncbi:MULTISPECIES: DUF5675 family protein [unclassified Proteiniphilum]|jgi:hypothetical protein|uniref:DUF5675 family protein n=1 Tax=unclassified Proteiniphilum TaxID=2622718 RepID=UPI00257CB574|nr:MULTISPECIES: DUF5675 family protein [unclassified Proteiniphilum]